MIEIGARRTDPATISASTARGAEASRRPAGTHLDRAQALRDSVFDHEIRREVR